MTKSSPIKLLAPVAAAATIVVAAFALEPTTPEPCSTEQASEMTPITKIPSTYVKPGDLQKPPPSPPAPPPPERPHPPLAR